MSGHNVKMNTSPISTTHDNFLKLFHRKDDDFLIQTFNEGMNSVILLQENHLDINMPRLESIHVPPELK